MGNIDDIKMSLMKVAANMPISTNDGVIPLGLLIDRGIVQRQADMKPVLRDCEQAAKAANAETLSLPAAVQITFDFAKQDTGGGIFTFRRVRSPGW